MEYVKPSPTGIDIHIQALQHKLYTRLKTAWGLADTDFECYGRAYRNQTKDGYIPEVYKGSNEYKEVFLDDNVKVTSFFGVSETITYNRTSATAQVYLIFMVNLDDIKPGLSRADEEAHVDVQRLLSPAISGFEMTGFVTGIDSVFKEYSGWRKSEGMKYRDMHPLHCFRINLSCLYQFTDC